jgi:hypothetical protein
VSETSDLIRSNFEPGRWLLVSGVMLSVVLMLQLYAINETVDVSSIDSMLGENFMGLLLIASYLLTTVAMIMVVLEYFSVKKKVDGLLALTEVLNLIEDLQYPAKPREIDAEASTVRPKSFNLDEEEDLFEPEIYKEAKTLDTLEQAFAALDDEEGVSDKLPEAAPSGNDGYKAIEVKMMEDDTEKQTDHSEEFEEASEPEPLPEVKIIEGLANQEDEAEIEDEVEGMLQQSEVISTLTELERVVDELKTKKPKVAAT